MSENQHPIDAELHHVLEAASIGVWRWDPRRGQVVWDANTEALFGVAEGEFSGDFDDFVSRIHPDDREAVVGTIMDAAGTGGVFRVRHRVVRKAGPEVWVEGRGFVQLDEAGDMVGGAGIVYDVTAQEEAAAERAALQQRVRQARDESASSQRRLHALAGVEAALASTLNLERLAGRLADYVVHHGAGLAVVDVLREGVASQTLTVSRRTAEGREVVAHGDAARSRRAFDRIRELPAEPVRARPDADWWQFDDPRQQDAARGVAGELVSLPLLSRGRAVGRLSAVAAGGGPWPPDDVDLLEAVAQRSGNALLQAELYTERSRVAAAFRTNLVPLELAQIPGFEVAVEYRPMYELASLGGDFFDVFPTRDGGWALAVGDVCGKGIDAAALAAPARHSLRAAVLSGSGPAAALAILNDALLLERSSRFLTAALAVVDPGTGAVRLATGGHPPPLVVRAAGTVEQPPASGHLLGVLDGVRFQEAEVTLGAGDSLVMYTDGLTELRDRAEAFGGEHVQTELAADAGLPAKAIAEGVMTRLDAWLGAGTLTDDVVVLVARATG